MARLVPLCLAVFATLLAMGCTGSVGVVAPSCGPPAFACYSKSGGS